MRICGSITKMDKSSVSRDKKRESETESSREAHPSIYWQLDSFAKNPIRKLAARLLGCISNNNQPIQSAGHYAEAICPATTIPRLHVDSYQGTLGFIYQGTLGWSSQNKLHLESRKPVWYVEGQPHTHTKVLFVDSTNGVCSVWS